MKLIFMSGCGPQTSLSQGEVVHQVSQVKYFEKPDRNHKTLQYLLVKHIQDKLLRDAFDLAEIPPKPVPNVPLLPGLAPPKTLIN